MRTNILATMLWAALFTTFAAGGCSHKSNSSQTTPASPSSSMPEAADAGPGGGEGDTSDGGMSYEPGTPKAPPSGNAGIDERTNRSSTSESIYPGDAGPDRRTVPEPTAPAPSDDTLLPHAGPPGSGTQPPPTP
jgi:hypothetical protein